MTTLVLSPRYTTDSRLLAKAARSLGWSTLRLVNHRPPEALDLSSIVLYGESYFVEFLAQELALTLAVPAVDFLVSLPSDYLNRRVTFLTLADFQPVTVPTFIKAADMKSIAAKVYLPDDEIVGLDNLPADTPLLLSEPVQWEVEYRCFIHKGQLATISIYMIDGQFAQLEDGQWPSSLPTDEPAKQFIQSILEDQRISLPEAVVVDVGFITGRGWSIIEANPAWSSGVYDCDPEAVLLTLQSAILSGTAL